MRGGARPAGARPGHGPRGDARGARVHAVPGRAARAARAARRAGMRSSWSATGTARCRSGSGRPGCSSCVDGVVSSAEVGAREARPGALRARRSSWPGSRAEDALHVGDSLDNDVAGARAAGVRAVLVDRRGRGAAGSRGRALARRGPLPTLRPMERRGPTGPAASPGAAGGSRAALARLVRRSGLPRGDQRDAGRGRHRLGVHHGAATPAATTTRPSRSSRRSSRA